MYDDFFIWLSDSETGWLETQTPTADQIKAYFNGWKYTGDGTTHSWVSIVDGTTAPATNTLAFVANPANKPNGYKNYFLSYQLAESVTEVEGIDFPYVEGDLSISGDAQVEVGEGVIVREEVTPSIKSTGTDYAINIVGKSDYNDSPLEYRVKNTLAIFKNGVDDTKNWTRQTDYSYGNERYWIQTSKFDPDATYTVTYEILDKYDFTTNINEVKATFANSLKSSFQSVVSKQSDIATDVSIVKRQMLELFAEIDGMKEV